VVFQEIKLNLARKYDNIGKSFVLNKNSNERLGYNESTLFHVSHRKYFERKILEVKTTNISKCTKQNRT
jgi:hypothetical protein